jgi:hypothetical protein
MSDDEEPTPIQGRANQVYDMLLEITPLVDEIVPLLQLADVPVIATKIKRCMEDIHDKLSPKRVRTSDVNRRRSNRTDDEQTELSEPEDNGEEDDPNEPDDLSKTKHVSNRILKNCVKLVGHVHKLPASRTPLDFIFNWVGEANVTTREYNGLKRIVAGYVPVDFDDLAEARAARNQIYSYRTRTGFDINKYCDDWKEYDKVSDDDKKMTAMEEVRSQSPLKIRSDPSSQSLRLVECHSSGVTVLSGILYRMQCIKMSLLFETRRQGRGGRDWVVKFNKNVFERKIGLHRLPSKEKKIRWLDPETLEQFEQHKKDHRWLVQSRNRLTLVYNAFGFAAVLDPSFTPGKRNAGARWTPRYVEYATNDIAVIEDKRIDGGGGDDDDDDDEYHTRSQRSRHAEDILQFIGTTIGTAQAVEFITNFCKTHRPTIDLHRPISSE